MIKFFEKHNKLSWTIAILIAIFIFYISSISFKPVEGIEWSFKTTFYHFIVFFFLCFFLLTAIVQGKKPNFIILAVVISLIYGISDEFHQFFVPGRYCSFDDVLIDSLGVFFASFLYTLFLKHRKK